MKSVINVAPFIYIKSESVYDCGFGKDLTVVMDFDCFIRRSQFDPNSQRFTSQVNELKGLYLISYVFVEIMFIIIK